MIFLLLAATFTVEGRLQPPSAAAVTLHAADSPWMASTLANVDGRFRFRNVAQGAYTLSVFIPRRGEKRITIGVGPGLADRRRTVRVEVPVEAGEISAQRAASVSAKELSVPAEAKRRYQRANQALGKNDVEAAIQLLEEAVEIAPQFAAAWNHLGTIAYQTRRYEDAEQMFRKALDADPDLYEPLVNLGGVLVTVRNLDEAWEINVAAVLRREDDPLAHSQLGLTYLFLSKLELAEKHLLEAIRLDPAHFSHPQLHLAEVYARRGERDRAARHLEDLLKRHPDMPSATAIRQTIEKWRAHAGPSAP